MLRAEPGTWALRVSVILVSFPPSCWASGLGSLPARQLEIIQHAFIRLNVRWQVRVVRKLGYRAQGQARAAPRGAHAGWHAGVRSHQIGFWDDPFALHTARQMPSTLLACSGCRRAGVRPHRTGRRVRGRRAGRARQVCRRVQWHAEAHTAGCGIRLHSVLFGLLLLRNMRCIAARMPHGGSCSFGLIPRRHDWLQAGVHPFQRKQSS